MPSTKEARERDAKLLVSSESVGRPYYGALRHRGQDGSIRKARSQIVSAFRNFVHDFTPHTQSGQSKREILDRATSGIKEVAQAINATYPPVDPDTLPRMNRRTVVVTAVGAAGLYAINNLFPSQGLEQARVGRQVGIQPQPQATGLDTNGTQPQATSGRPEERNPYMDMEQERQTIDEFIAGGIPPTPGTPGKSFEELTEEYDSVRYAVEIINPTAFGVVTLDRDPATKKFVWPLTTRMYPWISDETAMPFEFSRGPNDDPLPWNYEVTFTKVRKDGQVETDSWAVGRMKQSKKTFRYVFRAIDVNRNGIQRRHIQRLPYSG